MRNLTDTTCNCNPILIDLIHGFQERSWLLLQGICRRSFFYQVTSAHLFNIVKVSYLYRLKKLFNSLVSWLYIGLVNSINKS